MRRSRLLFAAVFGFAAALGVFYEDHNIGFTILYAMGLLLLLALVTILAAPLAVKLREEAGFAAVFRGEAVGYRLSVVNRSPFLYPIRSLTLYSADVAEYEASSPAAPPEGMPAPHGADLAEREAVAALGAVLPLRGGEWGASFRFPYRGEYRLGVEKLVVTDFLGLFSRAVRRGPPVSVLVYPSPDESFRVTVAEEAESISRQRGLWSEDYSSVADVQKYASSDSLRKIHWQLSAARGELIVKNFANHEQDRVVLFLDVGRLPPEMAGMERAAFEDRMIGCVAAATAYCAEARLPYDLDFGERAGDAAEAAPAKKSRLPWRRLARSGKAQTAPQPRGAELFAGIQGGSFRQAWSASDSGVRLARAAFDREEPPLPYSEETASPRDFLLFLHGLDERRKDAVAALAAAGHRVSLYLFTSPLLPLTDEARRLMEALSGYGVTVRTMDAGEGGEGA